MRSMPTIPWLSLSWPTEDLPEGANTSGRFYLRELEAAEGRRLPDSPTQRVGAAPIEAFEPVQHLAPLYSLDKTKTLEGLRQWDARVQKLVGEQGLPPVRYAVEYKFDGLTINLRYQGGQLVQAATRGNGTTGEGILAQDYLGVRPEDFFSRNESNTSFAASYNWGYAKVLNQKLRDNGAGGKYDDLSKPVWRLVQGGLTYKGVDGLQEVSYDYGTGWSSCFISTNCENPGRAICYMEFLKSPQGDQLCQWGIEGVHFDLVDGLPVTREDFKNRPTEERASTYTGIGPWYFQGSDRYEGIPNGPASVLNAADEWAKYDAEQDYQDRLIKKAACYKDKNPAMSFARVESDDDEMAMYTKITDQWTKSIASMITADSEAACEQAWNEFQTYAMNEGMEAVEAKMTSRYVENLKRYQAAGYFTDIVTE